MKAYLIVLLGLLCCACDDEPGCTRDTDCKGERICISQVCTEPVPADEGADEGAEDARADRPRPVEDAATDRPRVDAADARVEDVGLGDTTLDAAEDAAAEDAAAEDAAAEDAVAEDAAAEDAVAEDAGPEADLARDAGAPPDARPDLPANATCEELCARTAACAVDDLACRGVVEANADLAERACLRACSEVPGLLGVLRNLDGCAERVGFAQQTVAAFGALCAQAPPVCQAALPLDAACVPDEDCCGEASVCAETAQGPRCLARCAPEAPDCPPRAACQPGGAPGVLGVCVPGDGCSPGREAETCGGDFTCGLLAPASFCLPAGEGEEGEACRAAFDEEVAAENCAAGLFCAYGTCRPPCAEGCAEGRCVDLSPRLDDLAFDVCLQTCAFGEDCEEGICQLLDVDPAGGLLGECRAGEAGVGDHGEVCVSGEAYWGDCTPAHLCAALVAGRPSHCLRLCSAADPELCPLGTACVPGLLEGPAELGLCVGECDPVGGEGCPQGEACRLSAIAAGGEGEVAAGLCRAGAGLLGTGVPCGATEDCQAGHVCEANPVGERVCLRLCEEDADCQGVCTPGLRRADGGLSERVGVCL